MRSYLSDTAMKKASVVAKVAITIPNPDVTIPFRKILKFSAAIFHHTREISSQGFNSILSILKTKLCPSIKKILLSFTLLLKSLTAV